MIRIVGLIAIICLMTSTTPALMPQLTGEFAEFGIEVLDERFELEYLFTIEQNTISYNASDFMGGKNNEFITVYFSKEHQNRKAIKWYKSNKPSPFPVSGNVIMFLPSSYTLIFPAGKNAFYLIIFHKNQTTILFKVTGPFEPSCIPDWGIQ